MRELGLSTYAARTFVALVSLGGATAQEVSDAADVPRTRVYDAVAELQERGLVDERQSTPKRFWPVSGETSGRHFERYYRHRVGRLTDALDNIEPAPRADKQRGVWTVTGRETVTERLIEFVDDAEEEVVFMTVEDLLTDELVERLAAASERGVAIKLAGLSNSVQDGLRECVPGVELFESIWVWSETPGGRLLMVDQERTLVSVLVENGGGPRDPRDETAIWGSGATNSLVVVLRAMFTWQLDGTRE
ncbi:TrmB family transcriptional regulator [Halosimplex aquaticum]|uniref:TrmB family transcriptional regulator n=1 Tax=Halosimplex aquaticum TaxID=3026162 RepID=A0ABD5XX96_9EURY